MVQNVQDSNTSLQRFLAGIFQALAHPTRLAIVEILRKGPVSVGKILAQLNAEQPNVSQHLSILRAKRIVTSRKEGTQVFYKLQDPALVKIINLLRLYFFSHLREIEKMLKVLDGKRNKKGRLSSLPPVTKSKRRKDFKR